MLTRKGSTPHLTSAIVAAVLYVTGAVAVPLVHAQTEVLRAGTGIETTHSEQCPRIHAEGICVLGSAFQLPEPATHAVRKGDHLQAVPPACAAGISGSQRAHAVTPPARAPPLISR